MRKLSLTVLLSIAVNGLVIELEAGELFFRGDVNADESLDLSDPVSVFGFLFLGNEEPACIDSADANDDGAVDLSDGVYLLNHLFQGGAPAPPPSFRQLCPGPDPTSDSLSCLGGKDEPVDRPPQAELFPSVANAPGVRQRSRMRIPQEKSGPEKSEGIYVVGAGTTLAIVLEARSNRRSRAGFSFLDPLGPPAGNPSTLHVVCDQDLGDPSDGGVAAEENLAPYFLRDVDRWADPLYLIEHVTLVIPGDAPWSPQPGTYRFTASVMDDNCVRSEQTAVTLRVEDTSIPEVFAWIEEVGETTEGPLQHDAGTGNARVEIGGSYLLVVDVLPNGRSGENPQPSAVHLTADPPFSLADWKSVGPSRFVTSLSPTTFPALGNTALEISVEGVQERTIPFRLEARVPYDTSIQTIWNKNCTGGLCHDPPADKAQSLELVDEPDRVIRNLVNVFASEPLLNSTAPLLVWPYFPEQSYLFHKLRGTHLDPGVNGDGDRMPRLLGKPPAPKGWYLDDTEMHLVESWILQGAE